MQEETVLPSAEALPTAVAGDQTQQAEQLANTEADKAEETGEKKAEKTPEQKAIERLERKLGRVIGQREEARAERQQLREQIASLQKSPIDGTNGQQDTDSDTLTLSKAQLRQVIEAEAKKLAPTIKGEAETAARQREVVSGLVKAWGQETFTERTNELAEVLEPSKQMLVLDTDDPAALIQYLTDVDNADEAEAIGKLPIGRAGYALAKIAAKLEAAKTQDKPKASKAPAPIEPSRGQGAALQGYHPNMTDAQFAAWRKSQKAAR